MTDDERLSAFQKMLDDVQAEYDEAQARLARMKAEGGVKTVTYRELFGRKTMLKSMLALYERHGLIEKNGERP